jgi:hypothetical protein
MVCEVVEPTATLPKAALAGVRLIPACKPVPLTEITALPPCELVTVIFPLTVSSAAGLKVTFMVCVCPGVSVAGRVIPASVTFLALTVT